MVVLASTVRDSGEVREDAVLQGEVRAAVDRLAQDLRQAYTGDTTSPIETMTGTQLTFLSPDRGTPLHDRRIAYRLSSGTLERASATSTNTNGPPWTIPALGSYQPAVASVRNATVFTYFDVTGATTATASNVASVTVTVQVCDEDGHEPPVHLLDQHRAEDERMRRVRSLLRREEGVTMVLVVVAIVVLSVLSTTLYVILGAEQTSSNNAVTRDASFQAAEAGLHAYMAKLLDDSSFELHYLSKGESSRTSSGGTVVAGSSSSNVAWSLGSTWTYPNGFGNWRALGNGYEYSLQITPPSASTPGIDIVVVGRKVGATTGTRKIEAIVRQASVTDFQMLADNTITYGSGATTTGKIYASQDSSGTKHDVNHDGNAYADIYAEGDVKGSVTMHANAAGVMAKKYDKDSNPDIRTIIKSPISFSSFLTSISQIQSAATAGGVTLDAAGKVWWLKFLSNGKFTAAQCTNSGSNDPETTQPTCGTPTTYDIPSNGAVYSAQTVIVSNATTGGGVKGRVTVASNDNIVIADNIGPVTAGVDVLGLVAANNMYVASWVPYDLTWSAATIAQTGLWKSAPGTAGSHGTMTFTGSTATSDGGSMPLFGTRIYNYEPSLLYLQPPWFPVIADSLTTVLFRELPSS